jgi:hypothetical protein
MIWASEAPAVRSTVKSEAPKGEALEGEAFMMHLTGLTAQIMKSLQTAIHAVDGRGEAKDPSTKALSPFFKKVEHAPSDASKMHLLGWTPSERAQQCNLLHRGPPILRGPRPNSSIHRKDVNSL